ncbi:hypothetical protein CSHISOI_02223 [Colletotrichum shisoi]|uniref:Uncharacterized protein n=1 Tax=Colletotrichum shisoi TaxID=2078593 RepID=A0A5Q4C1P1_9PEZI|nr:hypothetical protein CSHISOI_02223 [Colletotrichum shisoi]
MLESRRRKEDGSMNFKTPDGKLVFYDTGAKVTDSRPLWAKESSSEEEDEEEEEEDEDEALEEDMGNPDEETSQWTQRQAIHVLEFQSDEIIAYGTPISLPPDLLFTHILKLTLEHAHPTLPAQIIAKKQQAGHEDLFDNESRVYERLQELQGTAIPRYLGLAKIDGVRAHLLSDIGGAALIEETVPRIELRKLSDMLKLPVGQIGRLGVRLGDLSLLNVHLCGEAVRIVDLEHAQITAEWTAEDEAWHEDQICSLVERIERRKEALAKWEKMATRKGRRELRRAGQRPKPPRAQRAAPVPNKTYYDVSLKIPLPHDDAPQVVSHPKVKHAPTRTRINRLIPRASTPGAKSLFAPEETFGFMPPSPVLKARQSATTSPAASVEQRRDTYLRFGPTTVPRMLPTPFFRLEDAMMVVVTGVVD